MSLRFRLLCPAAPGSRSGNRITALRWSRMIRSLGHRTRILDDLRDPSVGDEADVLVVLHARKCAFAARHFHARHPARPLVVALTGTDLYRDLETHPSAHRSLQLADRVILLQKAGLQRLPREIRRKSQVIHQSCTPIAKKPPASSRYFEVCVVGHMRAVKDPMRCALASRKLPARSRIRITQLGQALSKPIEQRALRETRENPRYRWIGNRSHSDARRRIASSHLLVLSSKMEGGANVIGEACTAGVPILASRIDGTEGLLGKRHPGFFEVGATEELARLLVRAEDDAPFYRRLCAHAARTAPLFEPERERAEWRKLISSLKL